MLTLTLLSRLGNVKRPLTLWQQTSPSALGRDVLQ
jgi:hypothetical protein